jgi:hypothetical protein
VFHDQSVKEHRVKVRVWRFTEHHDELEVHVVCEPNTPRRGRNSR